MISFNILVKYNFHSNTVFYVQMYTELYKCIIIYLTHFSLIVKIFPNLCSYKQCWKGHHYSYTFSTCSITHPGKILQS